MTQFRRVGGLSKCFLPEDFGGIALAAQFLVHLTCDASLQWDVR
jgi:hypothetical protein